MKEFHKRLQYVATQKKIDQADLIKALGKNKSTISKWWNGGMVPGPKNTRALSEYFDCDLYWLKTGDGEPYPKEKTTTKITASGGSTILSSGRDSKIISNGEKNLLLTELEREIILLNREIGNQKLLHGFRNKLLEIKKITEDF